MVIERGEHVAATDQLATANGRIAQQIALGEGDQTPCRLVDASGVR